MASNPRHHVQPPADAVPKRSALGGRDTTDTSPEASGSRDTREDSNPTHLEDVPSSTKYLFNRYPAKDDARDQIARHEAYQQPFRELLQHSRRGRELHELHELRKRKELERLICQHQILLHVDQVDQALLELEDKKLPAPLERLVLGAHRKFQELLEDEDEKLHGAQERRDLAERKLQELLEQILQELHLKRQQLHLNRQERQEGAKFKASTGGHIHTETPSEQDIVPNFPPESQFSGGRRSPSHQAPVEHQRRVQSDHSTHSTTASPTVKTLPGTRHSDFAQLPLSWKTILAVRKAVEYSKIGGGVTISVYWTFFQFLEKQFGKGDIKVDSIITVTGSVLRAQATTCGDYIRTTWSRNGLFFIRVLEGLWKSYRVMCEKDRSQKVTGFTIPCEDGESQNDTGLSIPFEDGRGQKVICHILKSGSLVTVEASRAKEMMRELVLMLAWAGAAFSSPPDDQNIASCRAELLFSDTGEITLSFHKKSLSEDVKACWLPLFSGVSIAYGFPIHPRQEEVGLEIPLQILAALLGAVRPVEYQGGVVIKGFSSMIIPIEKRGEIVQWHLVANADREQRLSYRDGLARCPQRALVDQVDFECLQQTRAVLGWCSAARCLLGSHDANYKTIEYSSAMEAGRSLNFAGGTLGFQQFGVAQLDFSLGPKDGKCHFQRTGPYQRIVSVAEKTRVVLYDTSDQRGWLVPASEVILHMCQHRHQIEPFEIGGSPVLLPCTRATGQSAKDILLSNASLDLCDPSSEKYTLKDLFLNYWTLLEFLLDQNVRRDQASSNEMHMPLHEVLQGYEYMSVVDERSPFRTKQIALRRTCGGWPALARDVDALVLFASGFGDILRPLEDDQSHHMCRKWRRMPKGQGYLATTIKILQDLYEVAGSRLDRKYLTSTHLRWVQGDSTLFGPCASPGAFRCHCVRVQKIVQKSLFSHRIDTTGPPGPVLDGFENGAVIFGQSDYAPTNTRPASDKPKTTGIYSQPNLVFVAAGEREPRQDDLRGSTDLEYPFWGDTISASQPFRPETAPTHGFVAGRSASSLQLSMARLSAQQVLRTAEETDIPIRLQYAEGHSSPRQWGEAHSYGNSPDHEGVEEVPVQRPTASPPESREYYENYSEPRYLARAEHTIGHSSRPHGRNTKERSMPIRCTGHHQHGG
ncbi:uncharacterized protein Z520_00735 [Fonsecaea multimorphosa CBS 102226]|uniref:Uncharacterized protein n=1 Tax=Fonsecaea multimorphosa CBS 102226 TaxID=1442371 RepID=A0A0D2KD35_9EURO|nr:uncharacterized protein Z520_00735 [Fonsecaea multimorphosa CBS 102226]KIY04043.1 hypothetical protein Z520_00735 [Fonsecaea multimorphosa CBS 102226]OAL31879.1 hypothetical protein AYO22_00749 [Fonsecaea multimorphosa]